MKRQPQTFLPTFIDGPRSIDLQSVPSTTKYSDVSKYQMSPNHDVQKAITITMKEAILIIVVKKEGEEEKEGK